MSHSIIITSQVPGVINTPGYPTPQKVRITCQRAGLRPARDQYRLWERSASFLSYGLRFSTALPYWAKVGLDFISEIGCIFLCETQIAPKKLSQSIKTLCPFLRILNTIQKLNLMFGTIIQPSFYQEGSLKMSFLNIEIRSSETKDSGENITNRDL